MCVGEEERARDAVMVVAKRAKGQGVSGVQVLAFEAMPHLFFQLMSRTPHAELCMREWADFCRECVVGVDAGADVAERKKGGEGDRKQQKQRSGTASAASSHSCQVVDVESLKKKDAHLEDVSSIQYEDAVALMRAMRDRGGTSSLKANF